VVFLAPVGGVRLRSAACALIALTFGGLHATFASSVPPIALSSWVVEAVYHGNRLSLFFVITVTTVASSRAGTVAETALAAEKPKPEEMASLSRRMFGRYVATEMGEALLENPAGLELGGETRSVTIIMTDLRGFTALSERLASEQVARPLNVYVDVVVEIVDRS